MGSAVPGHSVGREVSILAGLRGLHKGIMIRPLRSPVVPAGCLACGLPRVTWKWDGTCDKWDSSVCTEGRTGLVGGEKVCKGDRHRVSQMSTGVWDLP